MRQPENDEDVQEELSLASSHLDDALDNLSESTPTEDLKKALDLIKQAITVLTRP